MKSLVMDVNEIHRCEIVVRCCHRSSIARSVVSFSVVLASVGTLPDFLFFRLDSQSSLLSSLFCRHYSSQSPPSPPGTTTPPRQIKEIRNSIESAPYNTCTYPIYASLLYIIFYFSGIVLPNPSSSREHLAFSRAQYV